MRYSKVVLEHFGNPRNVGVLEPCSAKGVSGKPSGGPYLVLYLNTEGDKIIEARYQTYGCAAAIAAGSLLTDLILGLKLPEAATIDDTKLLKALGGLPLGKRHCASIAVSALRNAIKSVRGAIR